MPAVDTALMILVGAALFFSIIELGITAYIIYWWQHYLNYYYSIGFYTYTYHVPTPAAYSYLIFCSIIGIIVTVALIVLRFKGKSLASATLGYGTLVVTTVTTIFWLAGFANLASIYSFWIGYGGNTGIFGAQLAFAILAWLVFLAITVLNFLTAFGVLKSERRGFHHFIGRSTTSNTAPTPMTTTYHKSAEGAGPEQGYGAAPDNYGAAPGHYGAAPAQSASLGHGPAPTSTPYYDPAAAPGHGPTNAPYHEAPGPRNV